MEIQVVKLKETTTTGSVLALSSRDYVQLAYTKMLPTLVIVTTLAHNRPNNLPSNKVTLLTGEKAEKIRAFKSGPVRSNSLHLSNRFFFGWAQACCLKLSSRPLIVKVCSYMYKLCMIFSASMGPEDKQLVSPSFIKNINTRAHIHEPTYLI